MRVKFMKFTGAGSVLPIFIRADHVGNILQSRHEKEDKEVEWITTICTPFGEIYVMETPQEVADTIEAYEFPEPKSLLEQTGM